MALLVNLVVQTILWFGLMGAIVFGAAGTFRYPGGWLFIGELLAVSAFLSAYMARVDPGLLSERLKPPVQRDQPLADKLIIVPLLVLLFGGMGFMAADAERWRSSATTFSRRSSPRSATIRRAPPPPPGPRLRAPGRRLLRARIEEGGRAMPSRLVSHVRQSQTE